jgi:hypothetical protein
MADEWWTACGYYEKHGDSSQKDTVHVVAVLRGRFAEWKAADGDNWVTVVRAKDPKAAIETARTQMRLH